MEKFAYMGVKAKKVTLGGKVKHCTGVERSAQAEFICNAEHWMGKFAFRSGWVGTG